MGFLAEQEEASDRAQPRWKFAEAGVTESVAGTHQLHRFVGRWDGGDVGEWVVLCDRQSGEAVLDMARVRKADVSWRDDGALLVRIEAPGDARLMIIDPDMRTFREIGIGPMPRPIAELQGAVVGAARELGADGGPPHPRETYLQRDFSPDGRAMVEYDIVPQLMSHETRVPRLVDTATDAVLLSMPDSLHDGQIHWREGGKALLQVRHYSGGDAALIIDYVAHTFRRLDERDGDMPLALAAKELTRAVHASRTGKPLPALREPIAWRSILLILLLCVVVVGGTAIIAYNAEQPRQKLTPLPPMPGDRR